MAKVGTPLGIDMVKCKLSQEESSDDVESCEPQFPILVPRVHHGIGQLGKVFDKGSEPFEGYRRSIAIIGWNQAQRL